MKLKLLITSLLVVPAAMAQSVSLGGSAIPASVTAVLQKAKAAGALVYDVSETDKNGDLIYSPYNSTAEATGNMAFSHTEITPQKLVEDMNFKGKSNWISGVGANDTVTYVERVGGTGSISAVYDEAHHVDLFARGPQGQKWANNCGLLEDGSLHCLPAARRTESTNYILTNPDLSRGKKMLYNGHIEIDRGVVTGIEVSGKLSKLVARGKVVLINPIEVLKAWGFQMSPNLRITYGNTEAGTPVEDAATGTLKANK